MNKTGMSLTAEMHVLLRFQNSLFVDRQLSLTASAALPTTRGRAYAARWKADQPAAEKYHHAVTLIFTNPKLADLLFARRSAPFEALKTLQGR